MSVFVHNREHRIRYHVYNTFGTLSPCPGRRRLQLTFLGTNECTVQVHTVLQRYLGGLECTSHIDIPDRAAAGPRRVRQVVRMYHDKLTFRLGGKQKKESVFSFR